MLQVEFHKVKIFLKSGFKKNWSSLSLGKFLKVSVLNFNANFIYYFIKEVETTMFHEFFYQIEDKINLKFKT